MIALALASTTTPPENPLLADWLRRSQPTKTAMALPTSGQAALLANAAGLAVGTHYWLKLTPIKLRADGLSLRLAGAVDVLTDAQQSALHALLLPLINTAGFELHLSARGDWLLASHTVFDHVGAPPAELLGADVHAYLPQGSANRPLRALLSEIEIMLAAHGALVNGVWLSAGGCLGDAPRCGSRLLISDDGAWQAWAQRDGCKALPLARAEVQASIDTLVDLRTAAAFAALPADYFQRLRSALRWGRAGPLRMCAQGGPTMALPRLRAWH